MKESYYIRENINYCYFHPNEFLVGVCPLCLNERLLILAAKQGLKPKSPPSPHNIINKIPPRSINYNTNNIKTKRSVSSNSLPAKIFALGSLLHRRDVRHRRRRKSDLHDFVDFEDDLDTTSTSLEDESFISIKFGEDGVPSWDKGTNNTTTVSNSKVTLEHCSMSWGAGQTLVKDNSKNNNRDKIGNIHNNNIKSVVEHAKPRATIMRWRKRIGQLLQVIRWRRSAKASAGGRGVGEESSSSNSSSIKGERLMKVGRYDKGWIMRTLKMRTNS